MAKAARRNAPEKTRKVWTEEELAPFLCVPPPEDDPIVGTLWEALGLDPPIDEK